MLKNERRNRYVRLAVALLVGFVLGASASAGTLYSWKTDEGTYAFTNEQKRIPARYKGQAKAKSAKSLSGYERFTPGPKHQVDEYGDRLSRRLQSLRGGYRPQVVAASGAAVAPGDGTRVRVNVGGRTGRWGGSGTSTEISIPVNPNHVDDPEPIVTESIRMRTEPGHITTRHFQVTKQGDRVIAVQKDSLNDTHLPKQNASDFDAYPYEQ